MQPSTSSSAEIVPDPADFDAEDLALVLSPIGPPLVEVVAPPDLDERDVGNGAGRRGSAATFFGPLGLKK